MEVKMTVSQTIRVHGYPFKIVSDELLNGYQIKYLQDTFGGYNPQALKTLSEGSEGEPPLRTIVAKKKRWDNLTDDLTTQLELLLKPIRDSVRAMYRVARNEMFIDIDAIPERLGVKSKREASAHSKIIKRGGKTTISQQLKVPAYYDIKHELFHAIDDFGDIPICV